MVFFWSDYRTQMNSSRKSMVRTSFMGISLGRQQLWEPGETQTRICVPALTYFPSQVLIKGFIPKGRGKEVM